MDPTDEELVRTGPIGRQLSLAIAAVAVLLVIAVVKPWPSEVPETPAASPMGVLAASSSIAPSPAASEADRATTTCARSDSWRIVADDVEVGLSVRTWLTAAVEYSAVSPVRSTIPVTPLVSSTVDMLSVCVPAAVVGADTTGWSGTLWRVGGDSTDPTGWRQVARLTPLPGSLGALADPLGEALVVWPPGPYVLEARFEGSIREAWLELLIQESP